MAPRGGGPVDLSNHMQIHTQALSSGGGTGLPSGLREVRPNPGTPIPQAGKLRPRAAMPWPMSHHQLGGALGPLLPPREPLCWAEAPQVPVRDLEPYGFKEEGPAGQGTFAGYSRDNLDFQKSI